MGVGFLLVKYFTLKARPHPADSVFTTMMSANFISLVALLETWIKTVSKVVQSKIFPSGTIFGYTVI